MKKYKILITGVNGSIGTALYEELISRGHKVSGIDRVPNIWYPERQYINWDLNNRLTDAIGIYDVIVHLAANARVYKSVLDPSFSFENYVTTFNVMEYIRRCKEYEGKCPKIIFSSCLDKETKAFTEEGFKSYKDITTKDKVYSINLKTNKLELKKVKKVKIYDYDGDMINFIGRRNNLLVTPNHRMLIKKSKDTNLFFEEAKITCEMKTHFNFPNTKISCGNIGEQFTKIYNKNKPIRSIKEPNKINTKDLLYLIGLYIADGTADKDIKYIECKSGYNKEDYLKRCFDKKTGQYKRLEKKGNKKLVKCETRRIQFHVPKNDKARSRLIQILKDNKFKYSEYEDRVYLVSWNLYDLFKETGFDVYTKHIPKKYFNYKPEYLEQLYFGLFDGDGNKTRTCLTTVSPQLRDDSIILGFRLGFYVSFYKSKPKKVLFIKENRIINSKCAFYIHYSTKYVSPQYPAKQKAKTKVMHYIGKVWCLEVENNENFLVMRNGKLTFTGNSRETYGNCPDLKGIKRKEHEVNIQNCESPYSASKLADECMIYSYNKCYDIPYIVFRFSNVYGKYNDKKDTVIPTWIRNAKLNKPLIIYGKDKRLDFTYIWNTVKGIADSIDQDIINETINLGGGDATSLVDVAKFIKNYTKSKSKIVYLPTRKGEVQMYHADLTKAKKLLNYEPTGKLFGFVKEMINGGEY